MSIPSTTSAIAVAAVPDAGRSRLVGSVLAGALCLSVSAILVKVAGVEAPTTAFLRCALAAVVLVPLAWWEKRRQSSLTRRGWLWAGGAGVALGVDYSAWTASIYDVGAGISTVLINVQVIVLPLLALVIDRETVPRRFVAAAPVLLGGVVLVGGIGSANTVGDKVVQGTLLGLLAGIGYGTYLYLARRGSRGQKNLLVQPLTVATVVAAITAAAASTVTGGLAFGTITPTSWALLVILAVLGQVVAWLFIQHASVRLPTTTTAGLLLIQPVLALALAAVVLGEHPSVLQMCGAALVVVGVAVANRVLRLTPRRAAS
ncbi:DMT family transporter [Williamsia sp. SKLECPSW1]